jgi:hypothetical protein
MECHSRPSLRNMYPGPTYCTVTGILVHHNHKIALHKPKQFHHIFLVADNGSSGIFGGFISYFRAEQDQNLLVEIETKSFHQL